MAFECVGNESITYYAEPELRVAEAVKVVGRVCVCPERMCPSMTFVFFVNFGCWKFGCRFKISMDSSLGVSQVIKIV